MNPATALMLKKMRELAERGLTYEETAGELGAGYNYVAHFANRHDIKFRFKPRGPKPISIPDERALKMRDLYTQGQTLVEIGSTFAITRERVRQILSKFFGIRAPDGGQCVRAKKKRVNRADTLNRRAMAKLGCSYKEYRRLLLDPTKPTYAYIQQRRNARDRDIGWEMTFYQWWMVWQHSGHWHERGRGADKYGMSRLNDTGPYAVDNVYIATSTENMQDHWVNKRQKIADAAVAA